MTARVKNKNFFQKRMSLTLFFIFLTLLIIGKH